LLGKRKNSRVAFRKKGKKKAGGRESENAAVDKGKKEPILSRVPAAAIDQDGGGP